MEPLLNPLAYVLLMGATLGLIHLVLLLPRATRTVADGLHATLTGIYVIVVVAFALQTNVDLISWLHRAPWLVHGIGLIDPLVWLIGPLHLFYVRTALRKQPHWRWHDALHAIPAVLVVLELWPFYMQSSTAKLVHLVRIHETPFVPGFIAVVCIVQGLGYVLWSLRSIPKVPALPHTRTLHGSWTLRWFTYITLVAWLGFLVLFLGAHVGVTPFLNLGNGVSTIMVGWLGAAGYLRITSQRPPQPEHSASTVPAKKYAQSGLDAARAAQYLEQLQQGLRDEQWYMDANLTLRTMAERLDMTPHHLSQLINEHLGTTFHALVNEHCVRHAQALLRDAAYAHYTMEGIALEVGYSTRSTFYNAFKRHTDLTPAAYRKQVHTRMI